MASYSASIAASWAKFYQKNRWLDQDTHIELWSEKGTVRGLLAPVIDKYQIPFRNMHGFTC